MREGLLLVWWFVSKKRRSWNSIQYESSNWNPLSTGKMNMREMGNWRWRPPGRWKSCCLPMVFLRPALHARPGHAINPNGQTKLSWQLSFLPLQCTNVSTRFHNCTSVKHQPRQSTDHFDPSSHSDSYGSVLLNFSTGRSRGFINISNVFMVFSRPPAMSWNDTCQWCQCLNELRLEIPNNFPS